MKTLRIATLLLGAFFLLGNAALTDAAWAEDKGTQDLAKQSQNPVSDLISVPFENNLNFTAGTEDAYVNVLNVKPVLPVRIAENWNLINRAIVPIVYQGERFPGEGSEFGLGDITYQGFVSPAKPGKLIWGVGPALVMPTGSDGRMTSDKWSTGPAAVGLAMPGKWVFGALAQNVWSIGGASDSNAPDVNQFLFQYFINYNMKGGWYLTSAPTITANWEADDNDDRWTVPFGGGIGRVFKIGKQPVNVKLAAYWNAEKPRWAADWNVQAQITFLFPK
jgi:hypothetical protein